MSDGWRELMRGVIHPWHHDQFGHMNVRWYAHFFDDAIFHLYPEFGISLQASLDKYGVHSVTANASTTFIKELAAGDLIRIDGGVTRVGGKSVTFALRMFNIDSGELHATYEIVEVFFDPKTRKSAAIPDELREKLSATTVEL
jgi:acyl-CoA thioester hydrolase